MSIWNPLTWGKDIAKQQRATTFDTGIPEKVFVQGVFNDVISTTEYSQDAPAHLTRNFENAIFGEYGRQNFINLFYCLPEIFAPVHEIATRVADANWQLRKEWNDEVDYKQADFNRLFSRPNPIMSFKQFVYQAVCYEILTGANIEYFNRPTTLNKEPANFLSWWNLPSDKICIEKKKYADIYSATNIKDLIINYKVGERSFDVDNILPLMNLDMAGSNDPVKFRSQLCGASLAIKNLLPVYEARGVIYIKRGALGFLVSKKSDESGLVSLTKNEKEEAQREYQGTYGLTAGKNQVGVSSAPVEFIRTSMSIQELQPFDETEADARAIYAVLKVPEHLIPKKGGSTYANADADMKSFYANVIIPIANRYAESWTGEFKFDRRYIHADFSNIPELQENRKEKSLVDKTNGAIYLERFQNGICCLNDWIVSVDGNKGALPLYDKKIFDMDETELELVKKVLNLKSLNNGTTPQDQRTQTQGGTDQLQ